MKQSSIKKITLSRLIQVFIVSILMVLVTVALTYRNFFQVAVENKAIAIADIIKEGLTSHMKANIMEKRGFFLEGIASVHDIESIKIIRTKEIMDEYGKSNLYEENATYSLMKMLKTKEPQFIWKDTDAKVQAIIPYIANDTGNLNCLTCHNVQNGTVLGGVDIEMNISNYQKLALKYSYILALVLSFFALMIVLNMFHVIEKYVKKPLSRIIDDGHNAYHLGTDIESERYASYEFQEVAENINDFNKDVLENRKELEAMNIEIDMTLQETMLAMGKMEEIRSQETRNHTKRVAILSAMIAESYGLSKEEVKRITLASPLHDIGKIAIEDSILQKPGKLTSQEYEKMKEHPLLGYNALKHSDRDILKAAADIAYCHHEKYDGTGYPRGLKGEDIPLFARIVAVVDVLDALLCKRVYKEAWSIKQVVTLFEEEKGKQFEPKLVDIVLENIQEYAAVVKQNT